MSQCFKCGKKGLMLKVWYCASCKNTVCSGCVKCLPSIEPEFYKKVKNEQFMLFQKSNEEKYGYWLKNPRDSPLTFFVYFCSDNCANEFLWKFEATIFKYIRDQKENIIKAKIPINPHEPPVFIKGVYIIRDTLPPKFQEIFDDIVKKTDKCFPNTREGQINKAKNYELAYRIEDAAQIYENLGLWEEAGRVRKKGRQTTNMSVDVNQMLEQIRQGGIITSYKCPNCGGNIKIDGKIDSTGLKFCNFCGSTIKAHDLVEFLQKIL